MSEYGCARPGCGATICLTDVIEDRLRRTHESFMCPFGHSQSFTWETVEEAKVRRAEEARDRWREIATDWNEEFGTCPFGCGWHSQSHYSRRWLQMFKHFADKHGNLLPRRMVWASRRENWKKSA